MNNFYVLMPEGGRLFGTKWAYGEAVPPHITGESQTCPVCGGPVSSLSWMPPRLLWLSSALPAKWGDFVWGAGFSPFLVSGKFQRVYLDAGLSGITRFDTVQVIRVGKRKTNDLPKGLPDYFLVEILWNGANLDDKASNVTRGRIACSFDRGSVRRIARIVLEPGSWKGADIFEVRGLPGEIVVSERFRDAAVRYELKNISLVPVEEYAYDVDYPGGLKLSDQSEGAPS